LSVNCHASTRLCVCVCVCGVGGGWREGES
jgi:hypothetical protein